MIQREMTRLLLYRVHNNSRKQNRATTIILYWQISKGDFTLASLYIHSSISIFECEYGFWKLTGGTTRRDFGLKLSRSPLCAAPDDVVIIIIFFLTSTKLSAGQQRPADVGRMFLYAGDLKNTQVHTRGSWGVQEYMETKKKFV